MGGKPADTTITLTVDTENLTYETRNDWVVFSDDQGDPGETKGHPDTYVSSVNAGKKVIFQCKPKTGNAIINIAGVAKKDAGKGGKDILVQPIAGATNNPNGGNALTAIVRPQKVTGEEYYTVTFSVQGDSTAYPIDPRLKMN